MPFKIEDLCMFCMKIKKRGQGGIMVGQIGILITQMMNILTDSSKGKWKL